MLRDFCSAIVDCEHKTAPIAPVGIPSIRTSNIKNGRIDFENANRVSPETYAEWTQRMEPQPGDLILAREAPVGEVGMIPPGQRACLGQRTVLIRPIPELLDSRYLLYLLLTPEMRHEMDVRASGSTVAHLNMSDIRQLELPEIPPLDDQRAIASVLGSLDDKIELNRRMNRTLEQMAAAIFKAWFVDFEPVRAKASGAASFPGMPQPVFDALPATFTDSEFGPIPEGWDVNTFGDLLELPYGKALKADHRRPGAVPVYGSNGTVGWHDESLVKGPGIVVGRKGNPGTVEWCETDFFPIDTTFYVRTKSKAPSLRLLYYQLKTADLARLSSDSAVPGVNRNAVYGDACISPPSELTGWFDEAVARLWSLMLSNSEEIRTLAETRDALLPKLLSGEISVHAVPTLESSVV